MKVREIKNNGPDVLMFQTEDGREFGLGPGRSAQDVRVSESQLKRIRGENGQVTMDLSEVKGLLD